MEAISQEAESTNNWPASERESAIRDLATTRGSYVTRRITVEKYLSGLGLYDPKNPAAKFDAVQVAASFQRAALDIRKNPIKQRMLRDVLRGGTVPPIMLFERPEGTLWQIVDGLQRTHVLTEALKALIAKERGEPMEEFAATQFTAITQHGQGTLSVAEFLKRPVVLQVWRNLEADELIRLFIVLNAGQQKVSPRHLLEVVHDDLRQMFLDWNIRLLTEKDEKTIPKRRGRKSDTSDAVPSITHFRYEFLVDGLIAYVSRDPQIKTRSVLEDDDALNSRLGERVTEIGSEACKADFQWACLELNKLINRKYADVPKWRGIIQTSDNFFIPLMAALGEARANTKSKAAIDERTAALLELLRTSDDDDPLRFYTSGSDSLESQLDTVKSNIGRKRRSIVYFAWRSFFREGNYAEHYPLDWRGGAAAE